MDSFVELRVKLDAAREEYQRALEAQSEAIRFDDLVSPDGTQNIYHLNQALKIACERYTQALRDLTDHVLKRM